MSAEKPEIDRSAATFKAAYLHALEPIIRRSREEVRHWNTSGLIIEPVASGGCILLSTDGRVLAALFDPDARATRPMRLTIPDATFRGVTPPAPVSMTGEGDHYEIPLPEWAQPGSVYAWGLSIMVLPKMYLPGAELGLAPLLSDVGAERGKSFAGGYRLHEEPPTLAWRNVFHAERAPVDGRHCVLPALVGEFERISQLFEVGLTLHAAAADQPLFLTAPGRSDFAGAIMPFKAEKADDGLPAWALQSSDAGAAA